MNKSVCGKTALGEDIYLIQLKHRDLEAEILSYGAILKSLRVPDKQGVMGDVVLGFDDPLSYLGKHPCFGTINGRYANRIAKGQFTLDGKTYQLAINNGPNHLHGGVKGIDKVCWEAETWNSATGEPGVKLIYVGPEGEEGYPGEVRYEVIYSLTNENGIRITYQAVSNATTVINLTNHSYFNLAGSGSAMNHELQIFADAFTPTDEVNIPTGEMLTVENTPFDFRAFKLVGRDINQASDQLTYGSGYDHNFVLNGEGFRKVAILKEHQSGRHMEVYSTEPGLQLYTANHIKDIPGKNGVLYQARNAICLELQHFPDSPNHPHFPSTTLEAGDVYEQITEYRFGG